MSKEQFEAGLKCRKEVPGEAYVEASLEKADDFNRDVRLYLENVKTANTPDQIGELVSSIRNDCEKALPESDFTLIYKHLRDHEN